MKNINQILKENFTDTYIDEIEKESQARAAKYMELKHTVSDAIQAYIVQNDVSFKEIKEKLETSTSQTQRIISGESNFTLDTLIKVGNLIGKQPHISFI